VKHWAVRTQVVLCCGSHCAVQHSLFVFKSQTLTNTALTHQVASPCMILGVAGQATVYNRALALVRNMYIMMHGTAASKC
jgi:hypothetical protein